MRDIYLFGTPDIEWRDVPEYEGYYQINNIGQVRSVDRIIDHPQGPMRRRGRDMKLNAGKYGHLSVTFYKNGKRETFLVHRLVLLTFIGSPACGQVACHWNDIPWDNRLENLRWDTEVSNVADAYRNGGRVHPAYCKWGHEFTEENTYPKNDGARGCKQCNRIRKRRDYQKLKNGKNATS